MISCLHFKLCVTKIIRLPDGGYIRVQLHINPDCTQAVASLVRRERDSVREELGGGSNMKGSSFSELNRVLELRSLKDSTGHLNTNTMYCIKSKVSCRRKTNGFRCRGNAARSAAWAHCLGIGK